ncbi:MAG: hypothetical protein IJ537_11125 [Bacteroidaceae bacterium]|nr:hypothetical protein [Bacteroidaceae bacterium]
MIPHHTSSTARQTPAGSRISRPDSLLGPSCHAFQRTEAHRIVRPMRMEPSTHAHRSIDPCASVDQLGRPRPFVRLMMLPLLLLLSMCPGSLHGQTDSLQWDFDDIFQGTKESPSLPSSLEGWKEHLDLFGRNVPQEEVFLHLDNTCYFAGDTLYFKAYVRRSDTGRLTNLSQLLYTELWNQEGYMLERHLVKLKDGQGTGSFVLNDSLYGGFYELRAYTRWQLNWGEYQHPHTWPAEQWFFNKKMAKEFYRDYEKLYCRIFPLYDKPEVPGVYNHDMTERPHMRYFRTAVKKAPPVVNLYPEGGVIVEGTKARVAFEANEADGEHISGTMRLYGRGGQLLQECRTENRGRGTLEFNHEPDITYSTVFTSDSGAVIRQRMPKAESDGCAVRADVKAGSLTLTLQPRGEAAGETLGVTVMVGGALHYFHKFRAEDTQISIPTDSLPTGVAQVTVYNAQGRVYSDRLCFIRHEQDIRDADVQFSGIRETYEPFDPINLSIENPQAAGSTISLAVRDASTSEYLYDSSNILTEMLLCSQIRGFVEQPDYYFEKDDEEHRRHLDLLLMVQGWRKHNWITMATPGIFRINHPFEKTPVYFGAVYRYVAIGHEGYAGWGNMMDQEIKHYDFSRPVGGEWFSRNNKGKLQGVIPLLGNAGEERDKHNAYSYLLKDNESASFDGRNYYDEGNLRREVRVHAEYRQPSAIGLKSVYGDITTKNGRFVLELPGFYHDCILDLAASDTTKWKMAKPQSKKAKRLLRKRKKKLAKGRAVPSLEHQWIMPSETEYPEFYVRLTPYYPRFCKPFSYYHTHVAPAREGTMLIPSLRDGRTLAQVTVRTKHGGLRAYDPNHPAVVRDAYEVYNECIDAGFTPGWFPGGQSFAEWTKRLLVGDMNMYRDYMTYYEYTYPYREVGWSGSNYNWNRRSGDPRDPYHGARFLGGTVLDNSQYHPVTRDDMMSLRYKWNDPADIVPSFSSFPFRFAGDWSTSNIRAYSYTGLDDMTQSLNFLRSLSSVKLITDYAPRMEGSRRYLGDNQPTVDVGYGMLSGTRPTYRDRHIILHGYDVSEEFYCPNYSQRPLPSLKDYRRTLYWNPNLELDDNGHADVTFWNNSLSTSITVSAEGITPKGKILTGISYPEDRSSEP